MFSIMDVCRVLQEHKGELNKNGTNWSKCQRSSRGDTSLDQARAVCSLIWGFACSEQETRLDKAGSNKD